MLWWISPMFWLWKGDFKVGSLTDILARRSLWMWIFYECWSIWTYWKHTPLTLDVTPAGGVAFQSNNPWASDLYSGQSYLLLKNWRNLIPTKTGEELIEVKLNSFYLTLIILIFTQKHTTIMLWRKYYLPWEFVTIFYFVSTCGYPPTIEEQRNPKSPSPTLFSADAKKFMSFRF